MLVLLARIALAASDTRCGDTLADCDDTDAHELPEEEAVGADACGCGTEASPGGRMALVAVVAALRAAGHVVATEVTNGVTKQWFFRSRPS